ncbi:type I-F CRISPR-associated protein Csy1 [Erwinia sp.]|uniref:type I-F CRISPR-associated protein Csy1 n=1 Tax=Erwinia citreus TaxID=558 RepID=UPI003C73F069
MPNKEFALFVTSYIKARGQLKLEAFDKDAEKKLVALTESQQILDAQQEIAQQRLELEQRYEARAWLTDAANRAGQISLVTHALKFTHSDAKGSSLFDLSSDVSDPAYLSTATLHKPAIDAVGNAAVLDVAKLLQSEYQGVTLIECLNRDDHSPLTGLAESPQQLEQWVSGFKQVLTNKQPSSHKLAKQLYFPVADNDYHLISPLFSSSLAQALQQRLVDSRFSDSAKEVSAAIKAEKWHSHQRISYLNTAAQSIGGTKPQNISYLNSVRGGRNWLLPCAAPIWQNLPTPPTKHLSIFNRYSLFSQMARPVVWQLREFLLSVRESENNSEIRQRRLAYSDEIIDILFNFVAGVQNLDVHKGWSAGEDCLLKRSQQLWLDPARAKEDQTFNAEREAGDWKKEVAFDFGAWLNRQLQHEKLKMGDVERREGSTAKLFRQRLREFEQALKEEGL